MFVNLQYFFRGRRSGQDNEESASKHLQGTAARLHLLGERSAEKACLRGPRDRAYHGNLGSRGSVPQTSRLSDRNSATV